ncbi:unnamed protein product [Nippostrongylus brasiliensis]|uniref:TLC domain-containing protein n=1 Tax=Nippostrongylus brasiliensis TaxID=27835 RepID=A0A0N4YKI2_NIPBR|nr:unnamed protein product [Nippostrongylus brasiliensis]
MSYLYNALRFAFAVAWCSSVYYDFHYQPRLGFEWYIYKLVMLTNLNFVSISYNILKLSTYKESMKAKHICDVTCLLFWGLYAIDPQLVMPEWVAELIPSWLNHVTHTLPLIYVLFELIFFEKDAPTTKSSLWMAVTHVIIYYVIILSVRFFDEYWLYPLLEIFTWQHHIVAFIAASIGYYLLIRLSSVLSKYIHGKSQISCCEI